MSKFSRQCDDFTNRRQLSEQLTRLLANDLPLEEFDNCLGAYLASEDDAVREIALAVDGFHGQVWQGLRCEQQWLIDHEVRSALERCVVLLQSKCNYQWPPFPSDGVLTQFMMIVGVIVSVASSIVLPPKLITFISLPAIGVCSILLVCNAIFVRLRITRYWQLGQKSAWPFLNDDEYRLAEVSRHAR